MMTMMIMRLISYTVYSMYSDVCHLHTVIWQLVDYSKNVGLGKRVKSVSWTSFTKYEAK